MSCKKTTLWARKLHFGALPTPPADLVFDATTTAARFLSLDGETPFQFSPRDCVTLKAAGVSSNFGDGLLPVSEMGVKLSLVHAMKPLTGTLANVAGSSTLTVTGGALVSEACPGMTIFWHDDNGVLRRGVIDAIASDTSATLAAATENSGMYAGSTTAATVIPVSYIEAPDSIATPLWEQVCEFRREEGDSQGRGAGSELQNNTPRGIVSIAAPEDGETTSALVAQNSERTWLCAMFGTDLRAGQVIRLNGRTLLVDSIASQQRAIISHPDPDVAASEAGIPAETDWQDFEAFEDGIFVLCEFVDPGLTFKTVTIDAAFAGEDVTIDARVEIAHKYDEVNRG